MNPHLVRGFAPNPCDGRVGETIALGNPQRLRILGTGSQSLLDVKDVGDLSRKNTSILVCSCSSCTVRPRRIASVKQNRRSSRACSNRSSRISSGRSATSRRAKWSTPISRERTALSRDSSMVRPKAMTSPVAFIWVPRRRSARANLSKGQRGILATT